MTHLFNRVNLFADLATNHAGSVTAMKELLFGVRRAGAINKLQLFSDKTWPRAWMKYLRGYEFVPSVFRPADVDFVLSYKPLALKIASVESTYWDLINRCTYTDLPLIISTGGMNWDEVNELVEVVQDHAPGICLMHCVSLYPTKGKDVSLGRLGAMCDELGDFFALGWSSHYPVVDPAAFAMAYCFGATQFEVHVKQPFRFENFEKKIYAKPTLDEQCAFTVTALKEIKLILDDLPQLEGAQDWDEDLSGPDREFVLQHRGRWEK